MQPNTDDVTMNLFHCRPEKRVYVSMHVKNIGFNACNLRKDLEDKATVATTLTIRGKIYDSCKIRFIMSALKGTGVNSLHFGNNNICSSGAECLANELKYTNITSLHLYGSKIGSTGVKYLASALQYTSIRDLSIPFIEIGNAGMKFLADSLKISKVIDLDIGDNGIQFEGVRYLANALKDTNIIFLRLGNYFGFDDNEIGSEGLSYLAKHLKDSNVASLDLKNLDISDRDACNLIEYLKLTCVTSVSLRSNPVSARGLSQAANILKETQIEDLKYDPLHTNHYDEAIHTALQQNRTFAKKVKELFQKLVAQNAATHDLQFVIPNETQSKDMGEYLFLITVLTDKPNIRGYIFDLIRKEECFMYTHIVQKINEFVKTISNKFIVFINDCLPNIIHSFGECNHVNLLKEFEDLKYHDIVKNLLLHRVLYYVDDEQEILHPLVYQLLLKYDMVLYNEQLEPNKREEIISYYQKHTDVDGAKELINLLQ